MIPNLNSEKLKELIDLIKNNDREQLALILHQHPEKVNLKDERGFTPLIWATYMGNMDIANFLIEKGADVNAQDAMGNTALMGVSFKGHLTLAQLLIAKGAATNLQNNYGDTAIDFARKYQQTAIEDLLNQKI